ncbi:MAG: VOC family protein [Bacillota bacterium]
MELKKIDHIGILVENIEASLRFYRDQLGLPVKTIEANEEFKVRIAFLPIGEVLVELVEPFPDSPLRQYLKEKGEGLHHIAFEVDDLKKSLAELKAAGVPLLDEEPRLGGEGALVAFLDAGAANNVAIELKETRVGKEA